mgnify:CR=1 FL=1
MKDYIVRASAAKCTDPRICGSDNRTDRGGSQAS